MDIPNRFRAFRIDQSGAHHAELKDIALDDLQDGEVTIRVAYSSVNYKDALAGTGRGKILRQSPLTGGIDVAGHVLDSRDARFKSGDPVLVTGCALSESRDGGYSEYARLEGRWVIPLPAGLTLKESMILGTAGFTAALSLYRMEALGQRPDMGPIVVTGASGGVGSIAIDLLTQAGYDAHAISGKAAAYDFLRALGAGQIVSREGLSFGRRPLEAATWAGAIDNVGGDILAGLTRTLQPWGTIASCGLAASTELATTVMPFIIRGISLVGINSSGCAIELRQELWRRLAGQWKPKHLALIARHEVTLDQLPQAFERLLAGGGDGRTVVRIGGE
jgi:acrylyl-CoA reductase (NADPH)